MTTHYPPYRYQTTSPNRNVTTTELKPIAMDEQQVAQEIQIYDGSEVVSQHPIGNGTQLPGGGGGGGGGSDNNNIEAKLHYTNLDTTTTYIAPAESYHPYPPAMGKEYIFGPPPNNVLYKGERRFFTILLLCLIRGHKLQILHWVRPAIGPTFTR